MRVDGGDTRVVGETGSTVGGTEVILRLSGRRDGLPRRRDATERVRTSGSAARLVDSQVAGGMRRAW